MATNTAPYRYFSFSPSSGEYQDTATATINLTLKLYDTSWTGKINEVNGVGLNFYNSVGDEVGYTSNSGFITVTFTNTTIKFVINLGACSDDIKTSAASFSIAGYVSVTTNVSGNETTIYDVSIADENVEKPKYTLIHYTACGAPTSISVASNNVAANASVKLSWSGATAGTGVAIKGYAVYRSTSATGTYTKLTTVTTTATSGSVNVKAPSDNGSYYYKIATLSSVAGYDSPQSSTYAILTCKITACGAPTSVKLAATSSTGSNVRLSWSGATAGTNNSISGYEVQRRESADGSSWGSWSSLGTTTNTYLDVVPPTTAGHYYQYQVRTLGSAGSSYNSSWKTSSNTLRRSYTACGAPTACSLSVSTSTGSNATLSWSGATSGYGNTISSYEIQRAESSDGSTWGSWSALTTVTTTATSGSKSVAPPTTAGNYYKFRVRTRGSAGSSYYSGWKESTNTLRRNWTACGAPTACAVDSTLSLVATTLRWSGATDGYGNPISKYEVQRRSKAPGGSWSAWSAFKITSGTSLSVSPPATAGNYYQYRVRAQGTAGEAYYSEWKASTNTLRKAHKTIPAFTDPTLIVGQTDVKAVHITELQNVMNDILLPFMGVSTVSFTKLERDSDAKHWGDHVQEIKAAIDSTGFSHEVWVTMQDEVTADVIEQLRRIVKSM